MIAGTLFAELTSNSNEAVPDRDCDCAMTILPHSFLVTAHPSRRWGAFARYTVGVATALADAVVIIGLCIVVGFQTRTALVTGSLMIAALVFGTMLRQDFTTAWLQLDYAIAFFILIALRQWNLISVDAMMSGQKVAVPTVTRV